jgi:cytochrome bd-type quinol oxidase subunit 2
MSLIMSLILFPAEGNFRDHSENTAHKRIYMATMMVSSLLAVASVVLVYNVWVAAGRDVLRSSPTLTRSACRIGKLTGTHKYII